MSLARPRLASGLTFIVPFLALAIAGCGSGAASPSTASSAASGGTSSAPSTEASGASASASTAAAVGGSADACAVLPVADLQTALGVANVKASPMPGNDISYCNYTAASGESVAATSYMKSGGGPIFDAYNSDTSAVRIPGVADGAVISSGVLFVKKGDSVFGFQPGASMDQTKLNDVAAKIGASVAAHLP